MSTTAHGGKGLEDVHYQFSGRLHALDPASDAPSRRLWRPRSPEPARSSARCCGSPRAVSTACSWRLGGVGCSVMLADRSGVVIDRRGRRVRRLHVRRLGLVDRRRVEREVRGHQRHRHRPRRAAPPDHSLRPALLHPQCRAQLHQRADLRRARGARRRARRFLLSRRSDGRVRSAHRHGDSRRGALDRGGKLSPRASPRRASCWRPPASGSAISCWRSIATIWWSGRRARRGWRWGSIRRCWRARCRPPTSSAARKPRATI